MHRVELKGLLRLWRSLYLCSVPNAPCGVESYYVLFAFFVLLTVPNAPCGVESNVPIIVKRIADIVPNAPCGVESSHEGLPTPNIA